MAEARLAVAFRLQVNDDGNLEVNLDRTLVYHVLLSVVYSAVKRVTYTRNVILRTIYPGSVWTLLALLLAFYVAQHLTPDQLILSVWKSYVPGLSYLPEAVQGPTAALLLGASVWTVAVLIQRYALLLMLSYKGFLYVPHGKSPLHIRAWFFLVRMLEGPITPTMYTYQSTLPCLPLPSVRGTCERYLKSVRHLVSTERYKELEKMAGEFQGGLGARIQRYLWLWWLCNKNYVSNWWIKYVYLRGRSPIMINSNYYILDLVAKHTTCQAARASQVINIVARYKDKLDNELIDPIMIRDTIPLCMDQYKRTFGTTRRPGHEEDSLVHVPASQSQHVVIMRHGRFYELPLKWNGRLLTPPELEERVQHILDEDHLDQDVPVSHLHLPAMTGVKRKTWAEFRETHMLTNRNNAHALERIDSAAFIVVLDDGEPEIIGEKLSEFGHQGLHGSGCSRWFDKSIVFTVYTNARFHITAEHAWADAPVVAHVSEVIYTNEQKMQLQGNCYDADGHAIGEKSAPLRPPQRLHWEFNAAAGKVIEAALVDARKLIADLDLFILDHNSFGKDGIKKCRTSPDAFIQMALQLAYYRDIGHFSLTYEASMTRLYCKGRTETVRPGTVESSAFVHAMLDASTTADKRRALLNRAVEVHQDNYRNAMAGKGADRHLFTMYVVSQYLKEKSPFLDAVLGEPWRLSTSQTPESQTKQSIFLLRKGPGEFYSPGGGFGPVADDGYGVSYILSNDRIFFHISSKHSAPVTSSQRFAENIQRAMSEVRALCDTKAAPSKPQ